MKINKHEIWRALTQLTLRCLKYIKQMFNPNVVWHSYFLYLSSHFTENERNRWRNFVRQLWKCNFVNFIEILGNRCANTNLH